MVGLLVPFDEFFGWCSLVIICEGMRKCDGWDVESSTVRPDITVFRGAYELHGIE